MGVAQIRINSQPCKGINLITRHMKARMAPRVATVHDAVKESGRVLPPPSAVFHTYASVDTPWVARRLSHCTPVKRGKVSSISSTHEATKFVMETRKGRILIFRWRRRITQLRTRVDVHGPTTTVQGRCTLATDTPTPVVDAMLWSTTTHP
jgi:hypothetical protein